MGLFKDTLKFPFHHFKRIWWFWVTAIPALMWYLFQTYGGIPLLLLAIVSIAGWIALAAYTVEINRALIIHRKHELPPMDDLRKHARTGVTYFIIAAVWSLVSYYLPNIPFVGWVLWLYLLLVTPILLAHYSVTKKPVDGFDIRFATKLVFGNFGTYLKFIVLLVGITIVWALASLPIITAILTLPALYFGSVYLFAEFYKETA